MTNFKCYALKLHERCDNSITHPISISEQQCSKSEILNGIFFGPQNKRRSFHSNISDMDNFQKIKNTIEKVKPHLNIIGNRENQLKKPSKFEIKETNSLKIVRIGHLIKPPHRQQKNRFKTLESENLFSHYREENISIMDDGIEDQRCSILKDIHERPTIQV